MATPHVAGLVALVKSQYPDLNHYQIRDRIFNTANPISGLQGKVAHGRIDASAALEMDSIAPSTPTSLNVAGVGINKIIVTWNQSGDDGDEGEASRYIVKVSSEPITEDNWDNARALTYTELESASGQIKGEVIGLTFNETGFVALQAFDNVGNASEISESIPFAVAEINVILENNGTLDTFETIEVLGGL